jgi:hypothetical protein
MPWPIAIPVGEPEPPGRIGPPLKSKVNVNAVAEVTVRGLSLKLLVIEVNLKTTVSPMAKP